MGEVLKIGFQIKKIKIKIFKIKSGYFGHFTYSMLFLLQKLLKKFERDVPQYKKKNP